MNNFIVYINLSSNNIIITITDINGKTIYWCTPGKKGIKGSKKSTIYSSQLTARDIKIYLESINVKTITINIKGFNQCKESILRELLSTNYSILSINDITPIIFNGCRPKKCRRT